MFPEDNSYHMTYKDFELASNLFDQRSTEFDVDKDSPL